MCTWVKVLEEDLEIEGIVVVLDPVLETVGDVLEVVTDTEAVVIVLVVVDIVPDPEIVNMTAVKVVNVVIVTKLHICVTFLCYSWSYNFGPFSLPC